MRLLLVLAATSLIGCAAILGIETGQSNSGGGGTTSAGGQGGSGGGGAGPGGMGGTGGEGGTAGAGGGGAPPNCEPAALSQPDLTVFEVNDVERLDVLASHPTHGVVAGGFFERNFIHGLVDLTTPTGNECFVAWLDSAGELAEATAIEGVGPCGINAIEIHDDGTVFVGGWFSGEANFAGNTTLTSPGQNAGFVARLNRGLNLPPYAEKVTVFKSPGQDASVTALTLSPDHNTLWVGGHFINELVVEGTTTSLDPPNTGGVSLFLANYDSATGLVPYAHEIGSPGPENQFNAVATLPSGKLVLGGRFSGAFSPLTTVSDGNDGWLGQGTVDSTEVDWDWSRVLQSPGQDAVSAITIRDGRVFVAGYGGRIDFPQPLLNVGGFAVRLEDNSQNVDLVMPIDNDSDFTPLETTDIAVAANGDIFVTGYLPASTSLNAGDGVFLDPGMATRSGFAVRFTATGELADAMLITSGRSDFIGHSILAAVVPFGCDVFVGGVFGGIELTGQRRVMLKSGTIYTLMESTVPDYALFRFIGARAAVR